MRQLEAGAATAVPATKPMIAASRAVCARGPSNPASIGAAMRCVTAAGRGMALPQIEGAEILDVHISFRCHDDPNSFPEPTKEHSVAPWDSSVGIFHQDLLLFDVQRHRHL